MIIDYGRRSQVTRYLRRVEFICWAAGDSVGNDTLLALRGRQVALLRSLATVNHGSVFVVLGAMRCHRVSKVTGWNIHHVVQKVKRGSIEMSNLGLLHPNYHR